MPLFENWCYMNTFPKALLKLFLWHFLIYGKTPGSKQPPRVFSNLVTKEEEEEEEWNFLNLHRIEKNWIYDYTNVVDPSLWIIIIQINPNIRN